MKLASGVSISDVTRRFYCCMNTFMTLWQRKQGSRALSDRPFTDIPSVSQYCLWLRVLQVYDMVVGNYSSYPQEYLTLTSQAIMHVSVR